MIGWRNEIKSTIGSSWILEVTTSLKIESNYTLINDLFVFEISWFGFQLGGMVAGVYFDIFV